MNELALFAGGGGGILGGTLLGWSTVCAVEIEPSAREMLLARQRDGMLPPFPIWDDVTTFDGSAWRGLVDVISGGFPCQDISVAGKGAGIDGERSGLWREMLRIVCEVRPEWVFVENSPMLVSRGLPVVLGGLAEAGYDAAWCVLGADDVGAPHVRKRLWILAHDSHPHGVPCPQCESQHERPAQPAGSCPHQLDARSEMAHANSERRAAKHHEAGISGEALAKASEFLPVGSGCHEAFDADSPSKRLPQSDVYSRELGEEDGEGASNRLAREGVPADVLPGADGAEEGHHTTSEFCWWSAEPSVGRVADGVAHRVDRLKALGNGQVPLVAATAFKLLKRYLES